MNILHKEQDKKGFISEDALKRISTAQQIPISRLYGVVKFYTMFHTEPQGKHILELCGSPTCVLHNTLELEKFLEKELNVEMGQTTKDKIFSVYKTSCIGCCDEAPAMLVNGKPHTKLDIPKLKQLLKELKNADP